LPIENFRYGRSIMKKCHMITAGIALSLPVMSFAAPSVPSVSGVEMVQNADNKVTVTYTLSGAPAIITLDIQTNAQDGTWCSIGDANIHALSGAVNRLVDGGDESSSHTITWKPWRSWPGRVVAEGGARAVVVAWATNAPPPYMVVSLAQVSEPRVRYYPSVEALPGGLLENPIYRTDSIVLRRIDAGDRPWVMGSFTESASAQETSHTVTLSDDYYIGVFPITQKQWANVFGTGVKAFFSADEAKSAMRPMEKISYRHVRESSDGSANESYMYPNGPSPVSYLGLLRARTGIDFDLPSEAQWEFACRAGHGDGFYGDGSAVGEENLSRIACFGRASTTDAAIDPEIGGTPIVGSKQPNDYGLYDMLGCVFEHCLDWWTQDISSIADGRPNAAGKFLATAEGTAGSMRARRGGSWANGASYARAAFRGDNLGWAGDNDKGTGFRVVAPVCAK
jgi:formylglycine-generating enzyme required for sulfatase activity